MVELVSGSHRQEDIGRVPLRIGLIAIDQACLDLDVVVLSPRIVGQLNEKLVFDLRKVHLQVSLD